MASSARRSVTVVLHTRRALARDNGQTPVVTMDLPTSESPATVELDREHGLTLVWSDGSKSSFALDELRLNCPCAECRGLREQHRPVWPKPGAPQPLAAVGAELVGAWG